MPAKSSQKGLKCVQKGPAVCQDNSVNLLKDKRVKSVLYTQRIQHINILELSLSFYSLHMILKFKSFFFKTKKSKTYQSKKTLYNLMSFV